MYIRALAAVALVASSPGVWQSSLNFLRILGPSLSPLNVSLSLIVLAMTLTPLLFLAALARFDHPLHFPRRLRKVALVAIICFAGFIAIATGQYFKDILGYSPLVQRIFGPYLVTLNPLPVLPFLLSECSNVAQLLLLIAFYRNTDDEPQEPVSRFLSLSTKVATVTCGLWAALNVVRLIGVPYAYVQLRDYAWHLGKTPPTVIQLVGEIMPALLSGVAFFVVPFMVWRAIAARPKLAEREAQRL